MKSLILILFTGLFPVLGYSQSIYDFELENTEGELVTYEDLKGSKLTVIDFWATWCKPCVNSIPRLVDLYESYDKEEVAFIGISIDSPRNLAKVKPFIRSMGVSYPVLLDMNQEVMRDLNLTSVPSLLIINNNDEIFSLHEGFAPGDEEKIKKEIDTLLHE